jgi:hypothetical protein
MGRLLALVGMVALALTLASPVRAQDPDLAWQDVITSQVEAFRARDAAAAFSYAAETFHQTFATPQDFFLVIVSSGYAPIMDSKSHSFGEYKQFRADLVQQLVTFVGTDQKLYQSIYELALEPEGWRVTAVQLVQTPGVGV